MNRETGADGDRWDASRGISRRQMLTATGMMAFGTLGPLARYCAAFVSPEDVPCPIRAAGMAGGAEAAGSLLVTPGGQGVTADFGGRLNPTAAEVWRLADGSRSVSQIAETIAGRFGVARQAALDDVAAFVDVLIEHGFLRVTKGSR